MKNFKYILYSVVAVGLLYSCTPAGGNYAGKEYMPDMAHSVGYESQSYANYKRNNWDSASVINRKFLSQPMDPAAGTIPRGYAGFSYSGPEAYDSIMNILRGGNQLNAIAVPVNGKVPYHYGDTEDERIRASKDIVGNPFPISEAGLAKGKELYEIYCGICHGEKADGAGYLVRDANPAKGDLGGVYPAAPANFMLDTFYISTNGRFYHAIMYGKNVMGGYAEKLSFEERWQVIHYIRSLQATAKGLAYSASANTLNPNFGVPATQVKKIASAPVSAPAPSNSGGGGGNKPKGGK
ncbi:MAG TPA: cytochrome c [Haliscomenobacter sp.]|nr:cytochrome c [Haliscomenobacter sp.]